LLVLVDLDLSHEKKDSRRIEQEIESGRSTV